MTDRGAHQVAGRRRSARRRTPRTRRRRTGPAGARPPPATAAAAGPLPRHDARRRTSTDHRGDQAQADQGDGHGEATTAVGTLQCGDGPGADEVLVRRVERGRPQQRRDLVDDARHDGPPRRQPPDRATAPRPGGVNRSTSARKTNHQTKLVSPSVATSGPAGGVAVADVSASSAYASTNAAPGQRGAEPEERPSGRLLGRPAGQHDADQPAGDRRDHVRYVGRLEERPVPSGGSGHAARRSWPPAGQASAARSAPWPARARSAPSGHRDSNAAAVHSGSALIRRPVAARRADPRGARRWTPAFPTTKEITMSTHDKPHRRPTVRPRAQRRGTQGRRRRSGAVRRRALHDGGGHRRPARPDRRGAAGLVAAVRQPHGRASSPGSRRSAPRCSSPWS